MCGAAGTWSKLEVADALAGVEWLQLEGGEVGIQLRASLSSTDGVHNVEVRACTNLYYATTYSPCQDSANGYFHRLSGELWSCNWHFHIGAFHSSGV